MCNISNMLIIGYLDPGSGSALLGTVIALAGAFLYSCRSLFYRVVKGTPLHIDDLDENSIVILSEGKNYWGTFRPIVMELLKRKIPFRYYTLDLYDPALDIEDPLMYVRLYAKESAGSFVKLAKIKAPVMLATTPNIGTSGYPMKRSAEVTKLIHVFHAFADISAYHKGSLDHYDTVIMVGEHQVYPIRQVEKARNLPAKELIALGLPYIDDMWKQLNSRKKSIEKHPENKKTVLVASSWGSKGCMKEYGIEFVKQIAKSGYDVIVRPHPQSFTTEPKFIEECIKATEKNENIHWDTATVGIESMQCSDILVSDTSSIRFDYAFLYGKPVVTLEIPHESQSEFERVYMDRVWTEEAEQRIGRVVSAGQIDTLSDVIQELVDSNPAHALDSYRNEIIKNFGSSATAIVDFLLSKQEEALSSRKDLNA